MGFRLTNVGGRAALVDGDLFNDQTPPHTASFAEPLGFKWGPTEGGPPG